MTREIKLPPLPKGEIMGTYRDSQNKKTALFMHSDKDIQDYATAAVKLDRELAKPEQFHTEDDVRLILDAMDNIELRRPLANAIRRILGVPAP